jgi:hypothetical protein
LNQQNLPEATSKWHRLHLTDWMSEEHLPLLPQEELGCSVCQHFQLYIINNNQWLII